MSSEPYILYIEDERPMRELVRQALKMVGYDISWAVSGREGLALIRQKKPDMLLLDLMMPGVNGWEVYQTLKTDDELADIPIIVITARIPDRSKIIVEGLPPVDDYITKPFDVERLIRSVQQVLA
jgi:CheY-like chemotaxis protein